MVSDELRDRLLHEAHGRFNQVLDTEEAVKKFKQQGEAMTTRHVHGLEADGDNKSKLLFTRNNRHH